MSDKEAEKYDFLQKLFEKMKNGQSVSVLYNLVPDPESWYDPGKLENIMGLFKRSLSPQGADALECFEVQTENDEIHRYWLDFKWQLTAFTELQDIFDAPLYQPEESHLNMFHIWYFYYESRGLLLESILCGLNGLYAASDALLRVFLEFNLMQLYFHRTSHDDGSYKKLEQYFKSKIQPSWSTALKVAISHDEFCKPIKSRLNWNRKILSQSSSHAYHPDYSPRQHSSSPADVSFEGVYFWILTSQIVQSVLWGYYVNFPLLFHPRDILGKFGFNGPVGIFADQKCATAIKRSMTSADYQRFYDYSQTRRISETLAWFDSHPNLTDEAIRKTWNEDNGELRDARLDGYAKHLARFRALRQMMALRTTTDKPAPALDQINLTQHSSFKNWSRLYKRLSK